ncbi:MAG: phosphonate C-P lyase system protein PhnL [Chloroflexota bacterium]
MKILEVSNFSKTFHIHQLGRQIAVFDGLNFTLRQGEFILVSGSNGAGKSTLLRCLYRTYRPTGGKALYFSHHGPIDLALAADVDMGLLRQKELGFVTQFLRPRPRVTALELVAEPLLAFGMDWESAGRMAGKMLETFGLKAELWSAYPTTFSGGEQQKVNLARALIFPRRLLLLDEPTASLDSTTREALQDRLETLKSQGVAMIAVLHHPEDVEKLIDQRIEIDGQSAYALDRSSEYAYVD